MRLQNDEREVKCLVDKLGTLVGQFFSTGGAFAPPVKQLKNALRSPQRGPGAEPLVRGSEGHSPPP